jgi:hypothetical protein
MSKRPKTIFCDLDGTLVKHCGDTILIADPDYELEVLPGAHDKLREWDRKSYWVIITTGRKEGGRAATEIQLQRAGIIYNQLIMGFGGGDRILINDRKSNSNRDTAYAVNLVRNRGFVDEDSI